MRQINHCPLYCYVIVVFESTIMHEPLYDLLLYQLYRGSKINQSCSGVCGIDSTNQVKICSIIGTNNGGNSHQLLPRYATKLVRWELAE